MRDLLTDFNGHVDSVVMLLRCCMMNDCVAADRLYFVTLKKKPRSSPAVHYFSIDDEFVYNRSTQLS